MIPEQVRTIPAKDLARELGMSLTQLGHALANSGLPQPFGKGSGRGKYARVFVSDAVILREYVREAATKGLYSTLLEKPDSVPSQTGRRGNRAVRLNEIMTTKGADQ